MQNDEPFLLNENNSAFCIITSALNKMKLKFKNQTFQTEAVNAVVSLFEGQLHRQDTFTIINSSQLNLDSTGVRRHYFDYK
jgi:hypothetical protein